MDSKSMDSGNGKRLLLSDSGFLLVACTDVQSRASLASDDMAWKASFSFELGHFRFSVQLQKLSL